VENNDLVLIGKLTSVHGLKGNVKVSSFAETLDIFKSNVSLVIKKPDGRSTAFEINWAKPHARGLLVSLKGVEDRTGAEELIGSELFIEKSRLPELDEETYYWFDIIGVSVFTRDGKYLGLVESILQTGSNDVYVVKKDGEDSVEEVLIPALESVVGKIDLDRKTMIVDLPEGL